MAEHITVLTTTDSREAAEALARSAVEARVAACAQIEGPVTSVYWWEGEVQTDQEWRVLYKTPAARYDALEAHIRSVHTYDTPEIIAADIARGSAAYLSWLDRETTTPAT
ncbi:divalent-cation tolerance protein CutA [Streptomyces sp. DSM 44917]|uniref:Divalent-cation tolerance protein CutA n=1 Tax=Streptomyces boetiae TaxID=3075541 RepID=A0ABU2L400_9ACTN|nr:divalent-cation tolerance protein CutA [Streptomyces sp. DSM 44917]MDT0306287.1 divalent-cation tolerance protein CutA [Streptomyces sp. DSM 44917]